MKKRFTILAVMSIFISANAQSILKKATMDEEGNITVESMATNEDFSAKFLDTTFDKILEFAAPSYFIKNTRGVALADLDGDGVEEVIFGINNILYAMKADGSFLFEKDMGKPVLLPPAIADLDGDGNLEIALNYGYATTGGAVTVLDNNGNELPGWPVDFDNHWMINAPAVADVDGDGIMEIVSGERVSGSVGYIHVLKLDGTPLNENWPVNIGSTPAFTPSVGDVDGNGVKDIVIAGSSTGMYVLDINGEPLPGFPLQESGVSYSYQSPILADLDGEGALEIIGSNHGDNSRFYVMRHDGTFLDGWPIPLSSWTYSPPTVGEVLAGGLNEIYMGIPNVSFDGSDVPVLYGLHMDGSNMSGFPVEKNDGGNEGVITLADINNDGIPEVIFGNNSTDEEGYGFIHAFSTDGSGQIEGFPIRPRGFTFMNGAVIGDIDNDGQMDLTALSYTLNFGADVDSTFISTYNLNVPYNPDRIIRNGYKGNNTRDGFVEISGFIGTVEMTLTGVQIFPNPSTGDLNIQFSNNLKDFTLTVFDLTGRKVYSKTEHNNHQSLKSYNMKRIPPGTYIVHLVADGKMTAFKWIKK
ncbi:MAG: FG-GAP-like repeat-containing protein [Weeksellaceae bacterium]